MKASRVVQVAAAWAMFAATAVGAVQWGGLSPWDVAVLLAAVCAAHVTTVAILPALVMRHLPAPLAAYHLGNRHAGRAAGLRVVRDDGPR